MRVAVAILAVLCLAQAIECCPYNRIQLWKSELDLININIKNRWLEIEIMQHEGAASVTIRNARNDLNTYIGSYVKTLKARIIGAEKIDEGFDQRESA